MRARPHAVAALAVVLALLAGAASAAPEASSHNMLTAKEKAAGWKLLIDGRTTAGWRNWKKQGVDPAWRVEDGALVCADPAATSDLITVGQYADFELAFAWRIAAKGNSGVYFHVLEQGEHGYESGPEYQLLDNARGVPPQEQAGSLFGLYAPSADVTRPVGAFNESRLVVRHGRVEHWLNGEKVVAYELNSPDFKARTAGTKFARWPLFATAATGHIALQDHGAVVAFRDIKLRPLR